MEITVAQTRAPVPPDLQWPGDGTFRVWQRVVICRKQTIRAFNMPGSVHSNTRHARMYLHAVNEPGSEWKAPGNALKLQRVWAGRRDSLQNTSHSRPNTGPCASRSATRGKVPEWVDSRGMRERFRGHEGEREGNERLRNGFFAIIHSDQSHSKLRTSGGEA